MRLEFLRCHDVGNIDILILYGPVVKHCADLEPCGLARVEGDVAISLLRLLAEHERCRPGLAHAFHIIFQNVVGAVGRDLVQGRSYPLCTVPLAAHEPGFEPCYGRLDVAVPFVGNGNAPVVARARLEPCTLIHYTNRHVGTFTARVVDVFTDIEALRIFGHTDTIGCLSSAIAITAHLPSKLWLLHVDTYRRAEVLGGEAFDGLRSCTGRHCQCENQRIDSAFHDCVVISADSM